LDHYVVGALNTTENVIDKYLASPDGQKQSCAEIAGGSYTKRVRCISEKLVGGAKYQATVSYDSVKGYTTQKINSADQLIKGTTASLNASIQKSIEDANRVRAGVLNEIANRSHVITAKSDSSVVYLTKALSNGVANIADRLLSFSTPYLPEGIQKPAAFLASYAYRWQDRVQQASTAGEVWKLAMEETKQNILLITELFQSILNNNGESTEKNSKPW